MASMFSSLFSRDPSLVFPYEISDKIAQEPDKYLWTLNKGVRKGSTETFLFLSLDARYCTEHQMDLGKAFIKRLKTLKHPSVLNFVDSLETDKVIYVVTEPAVPLLKHLMDKAYTSDTQKEMAISWGVFQVMSALKFLNQEAKLSHNNLHCCSVYVTQSGEWKLGGLEYMTSYDVDPPSKPYDMQKYEPPERKGERRACEIWSFDVWGVACLIWESFNGPLPNMAALKSPKKIPKSWQTIYASLIVANPKKRPSPEDLLRDGRQSGGFLKNKFVDTLLFLEEFQLREAREKAAFFNHLNDNLDLFPEDVAKNKILPRLIEAYQYGDAGSSVLTPLFKIGRTLTEEEYQIKIVPCIVQLFSSTDRSTRVKLLEKIEEFGPHLNKNIVNDKIFGNLTSGFLDTNPAVREATVKAMVYLAPKLNRQNLDIELMKHLARLQSKDDQPGIRTNTTICLGKVGMYLDPKDRQKILVSAFTRALKDPFPPARVAGVLALSATQQYYQLVEIANRILPCLCPLTFDPEKNVRDQSFKAVRGFLEKLDKASENPEIIAQMESDVMAGAGAGVLSPEKVPAWASWALGAISGKFYKSSSLAHSQPPPKSDASAGKVGELPAIKREATAREEDTMANEEMGWDDDDEWGDIDGQVANVADSKGKVVSTESDNCTPNRPDFGGGWGEKFPAKKPLSGGMKLSSGTKKSPLDVEEPDFLRDVNPLQSATCNAYANPSAQFGSSLRQENPDISASTAFGPSGPIRTTLGKKKEEETDSWADFGNENTRDDWGGESWEPIEVSQAQKKRSIAEKQAQRKAELEEKRKNRALKLGAKKI